MQYRTINVSDEEGVTIITLDRPSAMNSISRDMHYELQAAFDDFAADEQQQICVLTGAGAQAFCAGSDLKSRSGADDSRPMYPPSGYGGIVERFDLYKPVIAAVNGVALGGGFELALACDLVIAAEHATFGLPEPRVGALALGGGLHRLPRQIGLRQAMGIALSGRQFTAADGLRMGFINEVVPGDELASCVRRWCQDILRGAPLSITGTKEVMLRGLSEPTLADALRNQVKYPGFVAQAGSEDLQEGVRAFAEKRRPVWKGR